MKSLPTFIKKQSEHDVLKKYVESFFMIKFENETADYLPAFPTTCMTMGFFIQGSFELKGLGQIGSENKFLLTKIAEHTVWVKPIGETIEVFGVHFHPNALPIFSDIQIGSLPNQINPVNIFGKELDTLYNRIKKTDDYNLRFRLLEEFLVSSIKHASIARLDHLIDILREQEGNSSIAEIAEELKVSPRTLRNDSNQHIGVSPKFLSRLYRFHSSLNAIFDLQEDRFEAINIALDNGYFDQSHFINDFKSFSGLTPKQFLLNDPNFRFFQF